MCMCFKEFMHEQFAWLEEFRILSSAWIACAHHFSLSRLVVVIPTCTRSFLRTCVPGGWLFCLTFLCLHRPFLSSLAPEI